MRVTPEGLVKGQERKKGCVMKNHGYRSYAVEVDGKLLRRSRVHLKQGKQVTEPNLTPDTRKSKEQTEDPARQNTKVEPPRQTPKITDSGKCTKKMELITALSLSTQVYKWVPTTYCWGITLRWTNIPSRGE